MKPSTPRVLGVDPGYGRIGFAIVERDEHGKDVLVFSECFETDKSLAAQERLTLIGEEIHRLIKKYTPDIIALEKLFFQKNVTTALRVAEARGVVLEAAGKLSMVVKEFAPSEVKVAVTGYGRASKDDMLRMIPKLLVLTNEKREDDEIDAIAVAITCLAQARFL